MERTFDTPHPVRLDVQNEAGLVTVVASTRDTTDVVVSADSPAADELVERTVVECRHDHVVVKVPRQGKGFFRRAGVTVVVNLPERSDITVVTASADVDVTGLIGSADFTTASGDVTTDDVVVGCPGQDRQRLMSPWAVWAGSSGWRPHRGICAARASAGVPPSPRRRATSRSVWPRTGWR